MSYMVENALTGFWNVWTGLFAPLPYGDPYVAAGALMVLIAMAFKLTVGRAPTS